LGSRGEDTCLIFKRRRRLDHLPFINDKASLAEEVKICLYPLRVSFGKRSLCTRFRAQPVFSSQNMTWATDCTIDTSLANPDEGSVPRFRLEQGGGENDQNLNPIVCQILRRGSLGLPVHVIDADICAHLEGLR
jgi:hypothetical protein